MARKAADKRGFGSLRKLPSGRWQARYTAPTGETVTAPMTFTAKIDAEAWLIAERKHVENVEQWQPPKERSRPHAWPRRPSGCRRSVSTPRPT